MTSEPAVTSPVVSPLAAIALKVAGGIAILSALLDFLILLIPPDLTNVQWQLATTTQMVDRGVVPLVGMALLLTGLWVDSSVGRVAQRKSLATDLRFWVCALASFLSLVYLLLILLHLSAVRLSSQTALKQVGDEAGKAATELQQRETEIGTRRAAAESRVKTEATKSSIRVSVISLLLAAGYGLIGWLGLRRLLVLTRSA